MKNRSTRKRRILEKQEAASMDYRTYLDSMRPSPAIDIERAVIGCMLSDESCARASLRMQPDLFFDCEAREVFIAIQSLAAQNQPITEESVLLMMQTRKKCMMGLDLACYSNSIGVIEEYFEYYMRILRALSLKNHLFHMMSISELVLTMDKPIDDTITMLRDVLTPINRIVYDERELFVDEGPFVPHKITDGIVTYEVYPSKYDSGGYCWVDGKAIKECKLIQMGFKKLPNDIAEGQ